MKLTKRTTKNRTMKLNENLLLSIVLTLVQGAGVVPMLVLQAIYADHDLTVEHRIGVAVAPEIRQYYRLVRDAPNAISMDPDLVILKEIYSTSKSML